MKDELIQLLSRKEGYNLKLNTIREYLQAFILRILYKNNFFQHSAFLGGTCLRFIYNIKRFSEDLDFSLQKPESFEFEKIVQQLDNMLRDSGYTIRVKIKKDGVYSAMLKFSEILFEAGMSHRKEENFSIKIEVDRRPPTGAQMETHIINKYFMSGVTCFNLATLFAGKINAVLTRNYVKGRDYYDLFWYLSTHKDLQPNIEFFTNAQLQFTGHENQADPEVKNWKSRVIEKVTSVDWKIIQKDMALLLEDRDDLSLFTKENLLLILNK
jgi:predicted nucleotidyltransferase component of viral defense system